MISHRSKNRYNILPSSTDSKDSSSSTQSSIMYHMRSARGMAVAAVFIVTLIILIIFTGSVPSFLSSSTSTLSSSKETQNDDPIADLTSSRLDSNDQSDLHISAPIEREKQPDRDPTFITDKVFFDVVIGDDSKVDIKPQRIVFGLFGNVAPRSVANFKALSQCDHGVSPVSNKPLCFRGSVFHRIIPQFMIQGGDFTKGDGTGGESIYGRHFADEPFVLNYQGPMELGMANAGPDTNGSQFFITTAATPHLNGKHILFGRVIQGENVVKAIEAQGTQSGKPLKRVTIKDSGILEA